MAYTVTKCLLGEILAEKKMTKAELSRRTGIGETMIHDYISLRNIMGLDKAKIIAEVLELESPFMLYKWKKIR
ncbi:helix-turn-helix transcriptional regulator [Paenibacillus sp. PDC88]|uniref:helix-turn-helix domain-containing protein n=1 Tax=Paenibacillus sp. PDC88 TaxID=1884375 RepID=UPI00089D25CA|nr:helix-turn-helix transcriptional regulator [Paenibacillus sp. PDC88]SDW24203.1 Helix-turn-helix [Paenibacillus sp. PDC88]